VPWFWYKASTRSQKWCLFFERRDFSYCLGHTPTVVVVVVGGVDVDRELACRQARFCLFREVKCCVILYYYWKGVAFLFFFVLFGTKDRTSWVP